MISIEVFRSKLDLVLLSPVERTEMDISVADLNRPGMQFCGFYEYFAFERPQLFGKVEMAYLETLDEETLRARLNTYFGFKLPCIIVCRSMEIPKAMLECARIRHIPIYRTKENTVKLEMTLINYLNSELAPHKTMHGVLVDVYGVGLLILGGHTVICGHDHIGNAKYFLNKRGAGNNLFSTFKYFVFTFFSEYFEFLQK